MIALDVSDYNESSVVNSTNAFEKFGKRTDPSTGGTNACCKKVFGNHNQLTINIIFGLIRD
ncbi:hypothetical protein D0C36_16010 [Mucilaginibacter conchicola]|uniref:Uncharacterized protein n=1 Tax=Mucilaginibacter conchicola TaxID=2303333 RepID=A0A372NUK6_9SPHI|nr:hypothetical protein [Mucilaginibacter conchicola]RFZ92895.1 hypothetical protein D0C36_16010 [Mucilaginibacter conchicola]